MNTNPDNEPKPHVRIWTIYRSPTDYPDSYVARLYHNDQPQDAAIVSRDLDTIRELMVELGLVPMTRSDGDEKHIVEVWI